MPKKRSADQPEESGPTFEEALADLQGIVEQLEDGSEGLEESLRHFERGIGLLRTCYGILESAEQRIEILTGFDAEGQPVVAPFDATATLEQTAQQAGRRKRTATAETVAPPEDELPGLF